MRLSGARLHRIEWAGQYPDISVVLGYVAWQDKDVARDVVERLLRNYVNSASGGRLPAPARLPSNELGEELARKYILSAVTSRPKRIVADEGPTLLLLMLSRLGVPSVTLNGRVVGMTQSAGLGDYYLYIPASIEAQLTLSMSECNVRQWVRNSERSISEMLTAFDTLAYKPLSDNRARDAVGCLASYTAARIYRNRSCHCVFSALASRTRSV
jgi:hypothetical protein